MAKRKQRKRGWSIGRMIVLLMIALALIGWAVAAAGYAQSEEGWRHAGLPAGVRRGGGVWFMVAGLGQFLWNALAQIPNVFQVATFTLTRRWGLLLVFAVLEGGALGFGWWLGRLERQLTEQDRTRRKSRPPARPPPNVEV